jgi:DNA repair protein SbcC/Rad50
MRPTKLEIEGFTSFPARVEIDFREIDLFAITGPTGAGKTSLLDAMLYALYGQTPRIGANEVRRLVSLGANVVKVLLEFEVGSKCYRVTRTAKVAKSTTTQIMLEELACEGDWQSVAGSVKEIGARIPELLGLDFEGFTRSVILPQGEFDKFLRGDPKQRTEILKDLLNLRVYERMMVTANSRSKELAASAATSQAHLESSFGGATVEALEEYRERFRTLGEDCAAQEKRRAQFEDLVSVAQELKQARESAARGTTDLSQARKDLEEALAGSDATQRTLDECERDIAVLAATFNEESWTQLLQAVPLAKQQQKLQEQLARRRRERQSRSASLAELDQQAKDSAAELAKVQQKLAQAQSQSTGAVEARSQFISENGSADLLRATLSELETANRAMDGLPSQQQVETSVTEAEHALEHLQTQHAAHGIRQQLKAGDACPVCEQVIKKLPAVGSLAAVEDARKLVSKVRQAQTEWLKKHNALEQARQKAAGRDLKSILEQARVVEDRAAQAAALLAAVQKQEATASREAQAAQQRLQLAQQEVASMDTEIKRAQDELREVAANLNQFPDWAPLPVMELEAAMDEQSAARQRLQTLQQRRERALRDSIDLHSRHLSLQNRIVEKEAEIAQAQSRVRSLESELRAKVPDLVKGLDELTHIQSGLRAANALVQQIQMQIAQTKCTYGTRSSESNRPPLCVRRSNASASRRRSTASWDNCSQRMNLSLSSSAKRCRIWRALHRISSATSAKAAIH